MEAAGIAPGDPVPHVVSQHDTSVEHWCPSLYYFWTEASLIELLEIWPTLPAHIVEAILALLRVSSARMPKEENAATERWVMNCQGELREVAY
jgi:hypothetical protein